jgi:hypothetical protein
MPQRERPLSELCCKLKEHKGQLMEIKCNLVEI